MWGHLKSTYEVLNWTAPNGIALNWTMLAQIKACIAKPSCEICALVRYFAALSGSSILTFGHNLLVPSSRIKKSKGDNGAWLMLPYMVFFLGTFYIILFYDEARRSRSQFQVMTVEMEIVTLIGWVTYNLTCLVY